MRALSRRLVLLGLGASCVPPIPKGSSFDGGTTDVPPLDDADVSRVIVVGAGMAGLAAGNVLAHAGVPVLVVDARDRLGGRIHTVDVGDARVDVGASWVHDPIGNPLRQLVSLAGLKLEAFDIGDLFAQGTLVDDGVPVTGGALNDSLLQLQAALDKVDASLEQKPDDSRAIVDVIASLTSQPRIQRALRVVFETNLNGAIEDTALSSYAADPRFSGGDSIISGGYGQLVEKLAASVDVALNREVVALEQNASGVSVHFADGSVERGSHAIVTTPLGVLKAGAIAFSPALSTQKLSAIQATGFGVFEKLVLQVAAIPASLGAARLTLADDGALPLLVNWQKPAATPALVALSAGTFGRRFAASSDADLLQAAGVDALTSLRTRWADDPFTRGAYSFISAGQSLSLLDSLAAPEGRVLFAGEHTSRARHGTVDGAFASGVREAKRLLQQATVAIAL